jgi:hypothetical protein
MVVGHRGRQRGRRPDPLDAHETVVVDAGHLHPRPSVPELPVHGETAAHRELERAVALVEDAG